MPIDLRNLEQYQERQSPFGLFNEFWHKHGDQHLAGGGLNEITVEGAVKLAEYAKKHQVDGAATDQFVIDDDERALMKAILEHPHYGRFIEQDAQVKLIELFGLNSNDIHPPAHLSRPKDEGEVKLEPRRVSANSPSSLQNTDPLQLGDLFTADYKRNTSFFEDSRVSPEIRGTRILSLLRDYTEALWSRGELASSEQAQTLLLDAFDKTRSGKLAGSRNFNGAPWSAAQSLALGLDPNSFEHSFPNAKKTGSVTYLSMNDGMAKAMGFADEYRAAMGQAKKAEAYEKLSPLGWMIGEESGHLKRGNLSESRPFGSSGLNWGIALFPGDAEIKNLPPKKDFEFPIDCLDAFNNFITCKPDRGERLQVIDERGARLTVEKKFEMADGKKVAWYAEFKDSAGKKVEPDKVLGVIVDARGTVKGDKKAKGEVNMWWWGFCDRNTAQQLYKSKFDIPAIERENVKVKVGDKIITVPKAEAQKLIDVDIPDIVTNETMCGFRFNDEPQQVVLKNGQRFMARVPEEVFNSGALTRLGEDMASLHDGPGRPLTGALLLKNGDSEETVDVKEIVSITKGEGNKVTIKLKEGGWRDTLEGELKTDVPWNKATQEDGKTVLKQNAEFQIRGAIKVTADGGDKMINASEIVQIVGEMQKDLRISQFMKWVADNGGMFATDSSPGEVVSNGMRWVNKFDNDVRTGDDRPEWAPTGDLIGIQGKMERIPGDKVTFVRGLFSYEPGREATSDAFEGWIQTDKGGRIINEGFVSGQPDFGWSAKGPLNWTKPSTFNPYMPAEMRVALFVNGVKERGAELDALAKRLNLPSNYKSYLTAQDGE